MSGEGDEASGSERRVGPIVHPHDVFARSLVGKRIGGRYTVDDVLGRGGMAVVVSGHHTDLEQRVAIKVMFPEHAADATLAKRFTREGKLAAKLRSPNLVRVTDVGTLDSGEPYLVMELLSGHDLQKELATRGALPLEDAADYVLQAATGLAELHALGIVHRDLKAGNLFLAKTAAGSEVKVLDYGISKDPEATTHLTATDAIMGTPSHMSPEQITTPKQVDARSDIWSLGVIFYELLTKSFPYDLEAATVGELFGLVLFSDPVSLRTRRPELPEAVEQVVMKCLQREPAKRWANVGELAAALAPFARPDSAHRVVAIARTLAQAPTSPKTPPFGSGAGAEPQTVVAGPKRQNSAPVPAAEPVTASASTAGMPRPWSTPKKALLAGSLVALVVAAAASLRSPEAPATAPVAVSSASAAPSAPPAEPAPPEPAPAPSASSAAAASTKPSVVPSPSTRAPRTAPSPRASASASAKAPEELILDRR